MTTRRKNVPRYSPWMIALCILLIICAPVFFACFVRATATDSQVTPRQNIIGIDLGNTYSRVAVKKNGTIEVFANERGNKSTPSTVTFQGNKPVVGETGALGDLSVFPSNTVFGLLPLIGLRWEDKAVQAIIKKLPFNLVNHDGVPAAVLNIEDQTVTITAENFIALLVSKMKDIAEYDLEEKVTEAIIAVPFHFTSDQRAAVKIAAAAAGVDALRIQSSPVSAGMTFMDKFVDQEDLFIVFDMGGTSLQVSLVEFDTGVFEVLESVTYDDLGGNNFNERIVDFLIEKFDAASKAHILGDASAVKALHEAAESLKRELSFNDEAVTSINLSSQNLNFSTTLTRTQFEDLNAELFAKALTSLDVVLNTSTPHPLPPLTHIFAIGGSSHIPKLRQLLQARLNATLYTPSEADPDLSTVRGAAILGGLLSEDEDESTACPHFEITPLNLGVETAGGIVTPVIVRYSMIPRRTSKIFTTEVDWQTEVLVRVYEGAGPKVEDHKLLGDLELRDLRPSVQGKAKIEITFEMDIYRSLNVTVTDVESGKRISSTFDNVNRDWEDIERILEERDRYLTKWEDAVVETDQNPTVVPNRKGLVLRDVETVDGSDEKRVIHDEL